MEVITVSIGDLWDKFSILLIKGERIKDEQKLKKILNEIELLKKNMINYDYENDPLFHELKYINELLWEIEDKIRIKELEKKFDNEFIELARSVYFTNDKRAEQKSNINIHYGSTIHEVKHYKKYK